MKSLEENYSKVALEIPHRLEQEIRVVKLKTGYTYSMHFFIFCVSSVIDFSVWEGK